MRTLMKAVCRTAGPRRGRGDPLHALLSRTHNHSSNPGEAGVNPALSRNREQGPPHGPSKSEHLANCGSYTVRGRRWSPTGPQPAGPTHSTRA